MRSSSTRGERSLSPRRGGRNSGSEGGGGGGGRTGEGSTRQGRIVPPRSKSTDGSVIPSSALGGQDESMTGRSPRRVTSTTNLSLRGARSSAGGASGGSSSSAASGGSRRRNRRTSLSFIGDQARKSYSERGARSVGGSGASVGGGGIDHSTRSARSHGSTSSEHRRTFNATSTSAYKSRAAASASPKPNSSSSSRGRRTSIAHFASSSPPSGNLLGSVKSHSSSTSLSTAGLGLGLNLGGGDGGEKRDTGSASQRGNRRQSCISLGGLAAGGAGSSSSSSRKKASRTPQLDNLLLEDFSANSMSSSKSSSNLQQQRKIPPRIKSLGAAASSRADAAALLKGSGPPPSMSTTTSNKSSEGALPTKKPSSNRRASVANLLHQNPEMDSLATGLVPSSTSSLAAPIGAAAASASATGGSGGLTATVTNSPLQRRASVNVAALLKNVNTKKEASASTLSSTPAGTDAAAGRAKVSARESAASLIPSSGAAAVAASGNGSSSDSSTGGGGTRGGGGPNPSLSPNTISSFHSNLMKPTQFSASSSKMAQSFLLEGEGDLENVLEDKSMAQEGKPLIGGDNAGEGEDFSFSHDISGSQYSESMGFGSTRISSLVAGVGGGAGGASATDLEWNPEAQRQQQEEWRSFQRKGLEASQRGQQKSGGKTSSSRAWNKRPDLREVDQTVNLMNASLDDYDNLMPPSTGSGDDDSNYYNNRRGSYYSHQKSSSKDSKKKKKKSSSRDYSPTNLMSSASQQHQDESSSTSGFFSVAASSLAEYWRDEPSTTDHSVSSNSHRKNKRERRGGRKSKRGSKKSRRSILNRYHNNCFFCSAGTFVLCMLALVGILVAWKTGAFSKFSTAARTRGGGGTTNQEEEEATPAPTTAVPTIAPTSNIQANAVSGEQLVQVAATDIDNGNGVLTIGSMDEFSTMLVDLNVSTRVALETVNSPQYLAHYWITNLEDPTLLCVRPPQQDDELHEVLLQAYALAVLYYSCNGPNSVDGSHHHYNTSTPEHYRHTVWKDNTNWMRPTPICHWYGLECEGDRHVVHLNMTRNNLKGSFPEELSVLSDLRTIDFGHCGIAGALPQEIWPKLKQLEYLWLFHNKLTGEIPPSFGGMESLQSLRMNGNHFTGHLPSELNQVTKLRVLCLQENLLDGSIPNLGQLVDLEKLELQSNNLQQQIPSELFSFPKLKELRAEKNQLTGTIPPQMQSMTDLRIVALDNNELSGSLDDSYDKFDHLEELRLASNKLTGTIPTTFGHLSLLRHLTLERNEMNGPIPSELSQMTELKSMDLYFNHFTGELPAEVCNLKTSHKLQYFSLDCSTKITGCTEGDACCDQCW